MLRSEKFKICLIVFVFTVQSLYPLAYAQDSSLFSRKRIAIVGFQHGLFLEEEQMVYDITRQTLQNKEQFHVLDTSSVRLSVSQNMGRKATNQSSKKLQDAYENFIQGVDFYRNLDLTQSIRELNRAVKGYRESISALEDNHYLLYAHLYLGMALYFDGRIVEGEKFIREMVMLDSKRKTRTLPSRDFPPRIVELHKKQTKEVAKISDGILKIDSTPAGARVLIDGMDVGETPLTLHDVPRGQHFLAMDLAGHDYYKQLVDVEKGEQNVIANLVPQKMFLAKNQFEQNQNEEQKRVLRAMAKELSVDYFILGEMVQEENGSFEMRMQSYDVMKDQFSSTFTKKLGKKQRRYDSNIEKNVEDWIDATAKGSQSTIATSSDFQRDFEEPTYPEIKKEKSGSKKWLWIGLGALVVGGGAVMLFSSGGDENANILNVDNPLTN